MEEISKKLLEENKDLGIEFLNQSTRKLEEILDLDETFPLSYYKLGYHYKFFGNFLKAKLIWTKYLRIDEDDLRLQEIRGQLEAIEDDVIYETGITYLYREEYEKSLENFSKLLANYGGWGELKYLLGLSYIGLGDEASAIEALEEALELMDKEVKENPDNENLNEQIGIIKDLLNKN